MSPVPSSLIVHAPVAPVPPVFVAVRLNVSPLSTNVSFTTGVRTNALPPAGSANAPVVL